MASTSEPSEEPIPHVPGEPGVWMFITGDVMIFTLLFGVFVFDRSKEVALFAEQQALLNQAFGGINTVLLLTSSWFVALGVQAARRRQRSAGQALFALATACGLGFVVIKYFEWGEKLDADLTIETNNFFMYYYLMTGIHLLHVLIGLGVLLLMWHTARASDLGARSVGLLESCASFWHLVDILWIALFALLYLMR